MKWSRVNDEGAQSMIELAILMGFLLLVLLGTVDVSRFLYYDNAINNAARVGAETAMEHCTSRNNCDASTTPIKANVILQSTVCESYPYLKLGPNLTAAQCGTQCDASAGSCSTLPCSASSYTGCCSQDVCISYPNNNSPPLSQDPVTVDVGYNFQLVTPFIRNFLGLTLFPNHACYTGDTAPHTLCARAIGRVD